ncbi:MAG TPA: RNA polymerase sigma factor [Spirochaetota bacterium]|nr:RNA polymerase sigma factor [Spirochaetota bacterium]HPL17291.1 RNA polymerase sigma factor [Spirochaetota bacterium]HQJ72623.1 RNA polymerase sigma factor [Spirochaetota bacterium]HRS75992.1 RNA polymerase sigma factor [Spirochaetota bacterium]HRT75121.1 RNA polymerase sigma factor [Spirochaetota bacterium]
MKTVEMINIALSSALSGDRESLFCSIWEKYRKRLLYYVTAVMHCSREDGEDQLQEIMVKVFNNLDQYRTGSSFNAWIYAIARNHCIDFKRKADSRPCGGELRDCDDKAPDPFEALCSGELNRAVHGCLEKMDDIDREMAYLRHFEGLRYKTIGKVVGMNENSVKTRMRTIEAACAGN